MPAEQFELLAKRAADGSRRQLSAEPPRLIRARHRARWDGACLDRRDRTRHRDVAGPADYELDPWSPAVVSATTTCCGRHFRTASFPPIRLRTGADAAGVSFRRSLPERRDRQVAGCCAIRESRAYGSTVTPGRRSDSPGSSRLKNGREVEASTWCFPAKRRPSSRSSFPRPGFRRFAWGAGGVRSSRARLVHVLWEVEAESGRIELELFDPDEGESSAGSDLWVSGATQIDLRGTIDRSGGPVNWSTEWLLELDPRNPKPLEVELDPGLELSTSGARGSRVSHRASTGCAARGRDIGRRARVGDRGAISGPRSRARSRARGRSRRSGR